jgi:Tol biopolymer transport system component
MAFIRSNVATNPSSLVVADADGGNQKVLVTGQIPELHFLSVIMPGAPKVRPAWSPDGQVIAVISQSEASKLVFVNTSDGKMRSVNAGLNPSGLDWISGSSLVIAQSGDSGQSQLWRVSASDGTLSRITNDVNIYRGISVGADRTTLVTARTEAHAVLWIGNGDATEGKEIQEPALSSAQNVLVWNEDRLVFGSLGTIFSLPRDTAQAQEIVRNAVGPNFSPDGKTLVYVSPPPKAGVWKADADGRNPVELVPGGAFWPAVTHDNQNVIYQSFAAGALQLWVAPLAGGKPKLLNPVDAAHPAISPDGKMLAFGSREREQWFISVCDLPDCAEVRHVRPMDVRLFVLHWTPDGKGIAYASLAAGANIWIHPLDGSPERQLTHVTDNRQFVDFGWSRDGKRFATARESTSQDIVLFRGIQPAK